MVLTATGQHLAKRARILAWAWGGYKVRATRHPYLPAAAPDLIRTQLSAAAPGGQIAADAGPGSWRRTEPGSRHWGNRDAGLSVPLSPCPSRGDSPPPAPADSCRYQTRCPPAPEAGWRCARASPRRDLVADSRCPFRRCRRQGQSGPSAPWPREAI